MPMNPRLLRPTASGFNPRQISGLALWLDGADASSLYTTDAGPVTAVASPLEISGCALWLDASDAGSITESGGLVSQWADKSGNSRHATASTTARPTTGTRTVGGRNALDFDGAANSMATGGSAFPTAATHTVFLVYQLDTASQSRTSVLLTAATIAHQEIRVAGFGSTAINYMFNNNLGTSMTSSVIGLGPVVFSAREASASMRSAGAGVVSATSGSAAAWSSGSMLIGSRTAGNFVDGLLCEIIIYPTTLTDSQTASVEAYLAAKWGISGVHAPATATSDPVGYWGDKSGTGHFSQAVATARPVVGSQNGRKTVALDGVNDFMTAVNPLPTSMPLTFFVAQRIVAGTSFGMTYTMATEFNVRQAGGGGVLSIIPGTAITGTSRTGSSDILSITYPSSGSNTFFVNGARFPLEDTGTRPGLTGTHAIGVRRATDGTLTFYANVQVAEILAYNAALTASQRQQVERYLAAKWGITLAPQVADADAQAWVSRVYAAGSTVSQPVADAVNDFVVGCKADGIWDAIKASCILAGADTLAGALVPLKGAAPTNNGPFVSGDYNRKTGLVGNASSKHLASGFFTDSLTVGNGHLAVYASTGMGASETAIGANAGGGGLIIRNLSGNIGVRLFTGADGGPSSVGGATGFIGAARPGSPEYSVRANGTTTTHGGLISGLSSNQNISVFALNNAGAIAARTAARLAFYSIGDSLNLTQLDSRVSALITAIGAALVPQVSNADAQDWLNRVYDNGGTVSTGTASAVNEFCNAIDAAGIRDRFYRLNLFAGTGLNAALVPVYRGPSRTGTQYGNTTDTNNGPFVSGDYTLTGGLNANGSAGSSSKYLDTGLAPDDLPALSSVHLAAWKGAGSIGGSTIALIGSRTSTQFWYVRQTAPTDTLAGNIGHGAFVTGASADTAAGLVTITRNTSGLVIYKDTTSVATDGARTPTANANDFTVFTFRNTDGTVSSNVAWPYAMYGYSAGVHLSSADVTAYHAAFAAFNTAMGRA